MRDYLDINTRKRLERIMGDEPKNVILQGSSGICLTEAEEIAEHFLCCGDPKRHSDYEEIEPQGNVIKKEQVDGLVALSAMLPVKAKKRVFLIKCGECMNESSQNALLKVMEDRTDTVCFIIVTASPLLGTIHSRSETVIIPGLSKEAFPDCDDVAYYGSQGVPEVYAKIMSDSELYRVLKTVPEMVTDRRGLLKLLHGVKEKDAEYFFNREKLEEETLFNIIIGGTGLALIARASGVKLPEVFRAFGEMDKEMLNELRKQTLSFRERFLRERLNLSDYFAFIISISH